GRVAVHRRRWAGAIAGAAAGNALLVGDHSRSSYRGNWRRQFLFLERGKSCYSTCTDLFADRAAVPVSCDYRVFTGTVFERPAGAAFRAVRTAGVGRAYAGCAWRRIRIFRRNPRDDGAVRRFAG